MPKSLFPIPSQYVPFEYVVLGCGFAGELPWEWVYSVPQSFLRADPEEMYFLPTLALSVLFVCLDYLIQKSQIVTPLHL